MGNFTLSLKRIGRTDDTLFGVLVIFALVILGFYSCALTPLLASAEPPHPSKHYRWETYPNGNVVLYFLEKVNTIDIVRYRFGR